MHSQTSSIRFFSPYSFHGMEHDNEVKGEENSYTTEFRQYDNRVGRWLCQDPVVHPYESTYSSMGNNPIVHNDLLGASIEPVNDATKKDIDKDLKGLFSRHGKKGDKATKMVDLLKGTYNESTKKYEGKIDDKEFNKASKGLTKEQLALAKAYRKTIEDNKTLRVLGVGQNDPIDIGSLDVSEDVMNQIKTKLNEGDNDITLLEIGQTTNPEATQVGGFTLPPSNESNIMATVLYNNDLQNSLISEGTSNTNALKGVVPKSTKNVKITGSSLRVHEMFGHGAYLGGITSTSTSNENMVSIQMENLVFTIIAQKTKKDSYMIRTGGDHDVEQTETNFEMLILIPEALK